MISLHVLYPKNDDTTFDMDYYVETHMPMLANALGDDCITWGASSTGGNFSAIAWAHITSREAFDAAMAESGAALMADIPNFTNVQPELVVGTVAHST